jgi:putative spermidine/putrescine transport system substrate-binding protein
MRFGRSIAVVSAMVVVAAACGSSGSSGSSGSKGATPLQKLGAGEGAISILAWPGYIESGKNDKTVDWVTPFEQQTGCKATLKEFGTSDEAVQQMRTGAWDVVSASGDATLRLIATKDVAPVNTALVPNYADIAPWLKDKPWNSVDGQMYGIPHGWGANLLMYNKNVVKPAPTSWGAVFDPNSPYKGKVTAYDEPIYIADAALYLMKTKPSLGIKDPYALDQTQFDATVALLKQQKTIIGEYWSDFAKEQAAFTSGSLVLGTTWQVITNLVQADKKAPPVAAILPSEGSTAWSDTWMVSSHTKHPNCVYKWLNWIASPNVQAQVAEWFGEAPANLKACALTTDKGFCKAYGAQDASFYNQLYYWTTPTAKCLDGRTNVTCTTYTDWSRAWDSIKG